MANAYEFYETLPGMTRALIAHPMVTLYPNRPMILDCCVGEGAITGVIKRQYPTAIIRTNDLDPTRPADTHLDATTGKGWLGMVDAAGRLPEWVITNPPFSVAHKIIPQALLYARVGVAFLLPLRFQEPTRERVEVLRRYPWAAQITFGQPRPSFTRDGRTDSVTTFWAIWHHKERPMALSYATDPAGRWR